MPDTLPLIIKGLVKIHLTRELDIEGENGIELILVDRGYLDFGHASAMIRHGAENGNRRELQRWTG
jgi:hypothetical protein